MLKDRTKSYTRRKKKNIKHDCICLHDYRYIKYCINVITILFFSKSNEKIIFLIILLIMFLSHICIQTKVIREQKIHFVHLRTNFFTVTPCIILFY